MNTLICGSIAYDTIMVFRDRFRNHILPDQIHILNVAFLVPDMRREFGGCAGNIAYNMHMLGGRPLIMATVGDDYQPYADRLERLNIPAIHIQQVKDTFTAQAFITTDLDDNQITAFHPGAMNHSHINSVSDAKEVSLGIVALTDVRAWSTMRASSTGRHPVHLRSWSGDAHVQRRRTAGVRAPADYVAVNDYEARLLQEKTGGRSRACASGEGVSRHPGCEGSSISRGKATRIPSVKPAAYSTLLAAEMPIAQGCYTASHKAMTGPRRANLPPCWGRSRSPAVADRTI
jgi:adenosine kinase